MNFYSARNINVTVGGEGVFAKNASLASNTVISPVHKFGSRVSEQFKNNETVKTSLDLSYFLTGVDPIKNHIENDSLPISANLGGLYLNSGYLASYSFSATPYQPIEVNAKVEFFEQVKGSFSASPSDLPYQNALVFSDFKFSETGVVNAHEIQSLSYSYTNEVKATFAIQELEDETTAHNVSLGKKKITVDITTNDLSVNLPETGIAGSAVMEFADTNGGSKEIFYVNGVAESQDTNISVDTFLMRKIRLSQHNLGNPPKINNVTPDHSVNKGNLVIIEGENFGGAESVVLLDQEVPFNLSGSTGISFEVPSDAHTGPLTIHTQGGSTFYSGISII